MLPFQTILMEYSSSVNTDIVPAKDKANYVDNITNPPL